MHRITITIDDDLMADLDRVIATRGYQNRSEAIRNLARAGIQQAVQDAGEGRDCVGALVYVYDHSARDLAKRLVHSFHDHHDLSMATLHVHLDHESCMEVTVLKGRTKDVQQVADHVIAERGVRHPLQECGLSKADVRALARAWGLPTWDKPATPCLSSRIAYGEDVTSERVRMIDQAEQWLRRRGLRVLRVRYHKGDLARIEVPLDDLPRLVDLETRGELIAAFRALGFKFVTLDLEGFRSGSFNSVIPVEDLLRGVGR